MNASRANRLLERRPDTYWDSDLVAIANIKGDVRRTRVSNHFRRGSLAGIHSKCFDETLNIHRLRQMIAELPCCLGGECLPDYLTGEVEIARLTLHASLRGVVAVRARRIPGGIGYRAVSDWERVPEQRLVPSCDPLRLSELADRLTAIQLSPKRSSISIRAT